MEFSSPKPIYLQIAERLAERITQGDFGPQDRIPSVRDVAADLGVNPNTVMRTFDHLQQQGIIYNRRGVGYFVADGAKDKILAEARRRFLDDELPLILKRMDLLGIDPAVLQNRPA